MFKGVKKCHKKKEAKKNKKLKGEIKALGCARAVAQNTLKMRMGWAKVYAYKN